jgi:hypothetical protein
MAKANTKTDSSATTAGFDPATLSSMIAIAVEQALQGKLIEHQTLTPAKGKGSKGNFVKHTTLTPAMPPALAKALKKGQTKAAKASKAKAAAFDPTSFAEKVIEAIDAGRTPNEHIVPFAGEFETDRFDYRAMFHKRQNDAFKFAARDAGLTTGRAALLLADKVEELSPDLEVYV